MSGNDLDPRIAAFVQDFAAETVQGLRIDGFNPDDPPPLPRPSNFQVREVGTALPDSPLVPPEFRKDRQSARELLGKHPVNSDVVNALGVSSVDAEIMVLDHAASYRGQMVELSALERTAVSRIVLRAIQMRTKAQLQALDLALPTAGLPESVAPKRRGRPKGVKNKKSANGA